MAQLFEHVDYLSREIGARPAGTEEEQQAALYIAEQFQKDTGFHTEIEEFTSSSNLEGANAILGAIVIVASILAMLFNMLAIPAFLLIIVAAAIYILEAFDHPFVSKALSRGASQNVVAKYQPSTEENGSGRPRSRKIVLVAHYDSGKVTPSLIRRFESTSIPFGMICVGGMAAAAFLMFLRIFFGSAGGLGIIVLNVLTVISLIITAILVVKALLYRLAPYNEGANNNATGVAALLEVAHQISQGSISEADLAQISEEITMHGEEAILESGLIPEGVDINYEDLKQSVVGSVSDMDEFEEFDEEERLLAAKAAIAALTGRPVENRVYATQERSEPALPQDGLGSTDSGSAHEPAASEQEFVQTAAYSAASTTVNALDTAAETGGEVAGFQNAPSWFLAAQKNAKKSSGHDVKVQRSRYSSALDNAERAIEQRDLQREEEERIAREAAQAASEEGKHAKASQESAEAAHEGQVLEDEMPLTGTEPEPITLVAEPAHQGESEQQGNAEQTEPEHATLDSDEKAPAVMADAEPEGVSEQSRETDSEGDEASAGQDQEQSSTGENETEADLGSTIAFGPRSLNIDAESLVEEADEQEEQSVRDEQEGQSAAAKMDLPAIETPSAASDETTGAHPDLHNDNPSRSGMFRKLRTDVPSLSGIIRMQEAGQDVSQAPRSGSKPRPSIPAIEQSSRTVDVDYEMEVPVSNDLEQSLGKAGVSDAIDVEERAEGREPNKVEMPASRATGLFSRFRKKNDLTETPQEWLDVDEDFNAREVGRKRGGWESFRDESGAGTSGDWEGGAFSRIRLGHVNTLSGADTDSDVPDELVETTEDKILNDEIEQIIHFRNPSFNTEVWFVAVGSDTDLHDGAKAFVEEHRAELRGSMIIELESLGAGVLSVASEEGRFKTTKASSRIKRFTRGATMATGIGLDQVSLVGTDSIASVLQREGFQSMHLFGSEDGGVALKGSADDVIENVDEMILEENIGFVIELLKHV